MSNSNAETRIIYGTEHVTTMFKKFSVSVEQLTGVLNDGTNESPESDIADQILNLGEIKALCETFSGEDFQPEHGIETAEQIIAEAKKFRRSISPQEASAILMILDR